MNKREINREEIHSFYYNYPSNHYDSIVRKMTEQITEDEKQLKLIQAEDIKEHFITHMQIYHLQKELVVLSKMRIIYLYMQFEITLKKLILVAYNIPDKDFYNWEKVIDFFKSNNIDVKRLKNYPVIKDIIDVNNSIKHSQDLINERTKNIPEFKNRKSVNSRVLNEFYQRTMEAPKEFIRDLAVKIDQDLYVFSENRLDLMVKEFSIRMDDATKKKFIQKLESI